MGVPKFTGRLLPEGIHDATWEEVESHFGKTAHRKWLLVGLRELLLHLAAIGCERVYLDGSFVTDDPDQEPGDFDVCWEMNGVDLSALDPILADLAFPRAAQKTKYRGDVLPNVIEGSSGVPFVDFFQQDKATGERKGIIALDPRGVK